MRLAACGVLLVALLAACGTQPTPDSSSAADTVSTTTATTSPQPPDNSATSPASAAASHWKMPNLVGQNLQTAQDRVQALTGNPLFITKSHDATGAGRHQILDRDWTVCSQNIAPGKAFDERSTIDFGAVKNNESCP